MVKRSIELIGLPVISIEEGVEVGKIREIVLDPQKKEIMGLLVQDEKWWRDTKVVSFALISGIGEYAVTVENTSTVASLSSMPEIEELLESKVQVKGKEVITRSGRLIGKVQEYFVDPKSGKIEAYELVTPFSPEQEEIVLVPASCVLTIGKNVVVVIEEVDKYIKKGEVRPAMESWAKISPREEKITSTLSDTQVEELLKSAEKEISTSPEAPPKFEEEMEEVKKKEEEAPSEEAEIEDLSKTPSAPEVVEEVKPQAEEVEPAKPSEPVAKKPDLTKIFEERQKKFILGKKASRKIEDNEGNVLINEGEIITEDSIEKVKSAGKFMELTLSIKMEE